jgi:hypothetical protein
MEQGAALCRDPYAQEPGEGPREYANIRMKPIDRLVALARECLGTARLQRTGGTLYSGHGTLRPGDVYLLGTNPGGVGEGKNTLDALLDTLPSSGENEFFQGQWDERSKRLQQTIKAVLRLVSPNPMEVCASNLIFVRSSAQNELPENFWKLAEVCWPVHEFILSVVQPRVVITFGNGEAESPYAFLRHKLRPVAELQPVLVGHGKAACKAFTARSQGRELRVLGIPHPSRHSLRVDSGDEPESLKPTLRNWLRAQLDEGRSAP